MSTPEVPKSEVPNPARGKLYAVVSASIAAVGLWAAFLPLGFGFVTVFVAVPGVILGGLAGRHGLTSAGPWVSRANMLPVLVYVGYMVSYVPEETTDHTFAAQVVEAGVLADQSVFDDKVQAAGKIAGLRLRVAPCDHEFIVRVTGKPNAHLGLYVPTKVTRECLAGIQTGQTVDMQVISTERALTGVVKGYKITQIGPCAIEDVDMGAVIKGTTCPSWF